MATNHTSYHGVYGNSTNHTSSYVWKQHQLYRIPHSNIVETYLPTWIVASQTWDLTQCNKWQTVCSNSDVAQYPQWRQITIVGPRERWLRKHQNWLHVRKQRQVPSLTAHTPNLTGKRIKTGESGDTQRQNWPQASRQINSSRSENTTPELTSSTHRHAAYVRNDDTRRLSWWRCCQVRGECWGNRTDQDRGQSCYTRSDGCSNSWQRSLPRHAVMSPPGPGGETSCRSLRSALEHTHTRARARFAFIILARVQSIVIWSDANQYTDRPWATMLWGWQTFFFWSVYTNTKQKCLPFSNWYHSSHHVTIYDRFFILWAQHFSFRGRSGRSLIVEIESVFMLYMYHKTQLWLLIKITPNAVPDRLSSPWKLILTAISPSPGNSPRHLDCSFCS